jgi:hypothetical protein
MFSKSLAVYVLRLIISLSVINTGGYCYLPSEVYIYVREALDVQFWTLLDLLIY